MAQPSLTIVAFKLISPQKQTVMADSDSTEENNNLKRYDGKIKLVKGN